MTGQLLTTGQAARRLGLSRYAVRRAAQCGAIAVAQRTSGGRLRFDPAALDAYARCLAAGHRAVPSNLNSALHDAPDLLRLAFASMACGVVIRDAAGRVADANAAAQHILGLPLEQLRGRPLSGALGATTRPDGSALPNDERPVVLAARTGQPQRGQLIGITRPDGAVRWLQLDAVPVRTDGAPGPIVISFVDTTDRVRAEEALRASEARFRATFDQAAVGVAHLDLEGRWLRVNERLCALLGYTRDELLVRTFREVTHPDEDMGAHLALIDRLRAGEIDTCTLEKRYRRKDGATIWATVTVSQVRDGPGRDAYLLAMIEDITARKQAEAALQYQALHDTLTGLPNRALLHDRLSQALHQAARSHTSLTLMLLDLDRFKEVNDTLGHEAGDALLIHVAARVRTALRSGDTVARLGGDEFAVVLPGVGGDQAARMARAVLAALAAPVTLEGQTVVAGGSLGVALSPDHGEDSTTLLRHADVAMYAAKRAGGGYAVYTPTHDQHSAQRLSLIAALQQAIARDELRLHYQPIVDVHTGAVSMVEALVRWQHPTQGLLLPARFIPLAESTGLITPLTQWVLRTALCQLRRWRDGGLDLGVAINLAAHTAHDPALPETIAALLEEHVVPAAALRVELTESTVMADPAGAVGVLGQLADLGVRIAIDDFGTGYSSLAYLKRLPVDEIKLDRSFVTSMTTDSDDATIVASTIGLGHSLGLRFVAEGVESRAVWQSLDALGCDAAQGFYFSRALPAEDLERWLCTTPWAKGAPPP